MNESQMDDKQQQIVLKNYFIDSKVIKTPQDINKLVSMFGNIKITNMKLLYLASQNQFSIQKFHQKCDNIPYTLIVLQNQYGKILGGFTPLCWVRKQEKYVTDQQEMSFLFSLTKNQKFTLVSKQHAIQRCANGSHGPIFGGGWNFYVSDRANLEAKSGFFVHKTYYANDKYQENSKQSFIQLGGNPKHFIFKVKQWEVWQIQVQNK